MYNGMKTRYVQRVKEYFTEETVCLEAENALVAG